MALTAGKKLGPYEILSPLGAGGMGEVYRARDTKLDRDVALKVLPPELAGEPDRRSRLLHEARAAASLNHPNICTVHDVGEADGQIYIAMELISGLPLDAYLAGRTASLGEIVRYGVQMAEALAHAHDRGLVHRDFKSANVIVTPEGRAKVLDFGLAKRIGSEATAEAATRSLAPVTQPGTIVGTLPYLAPEQFRGQPADAACDVWALGVVLYEMASGTRPFGGKTAFELGSAVLTNPLPPLPTALPRPLREVIARCLEKDPTRRYHRGAEARAALEAIASDVTAPEVKADAPNRAWRHRFGLAVGTVLSVLIVAAAFNVSKVRNWLGGGGAAETIQSLAVLPLANFSRDAEQDYFSDGMTEALITDLAQIGSLRVISRTSVMRYKSTDKSIPQIGRELNVDAVLEGSVQRSGGRVLVTTQLIHAATDRHLWSRSYERDMKDILSLQGEIARSVAAEIRVAVSPQEQARLARAASVDPDVHELYLRGRLHASRGTESEIVKAIDFFQRALDKNAEHAPAYAGLADSYFLLSDVYRPPAEVLPKAKAAAIKALDLDSGLAEAHTSLGIVHIFWDWDWAAAEREFQRAIEINPGYALAHDFYSVLLVTALGRLEQGVAESRRARALDPLSPQMHVDAGWWVHFLGRQYDEAIAENLKAIDLQPDFGVAHAQLAVAYAAVGRRAEALAAADKGPQVDDSPLVLAMASGVYATLGEREKARQALAQLQEIATQRYVCPYELGVTYLGLGDRDEAFRWFEKGFQDRSSCMPGTKADSRLDSIRSDPRYIDLVRRIGFPP